MVACGIGSVLYHTANALKLTAARTGNGPPGGTIPVVEAGDYVIRRCTGSSGIVD